MGKEGGYLGTCDCVEWVEVVGFIFGCDVGGGELIDVVFVDEVVVVIEVVFFFVVVVVKGFDEEGSYLVLVYYFVWVELVVGWWVVFLCDIGFGEVIDVILED